MLTELIEREIEELARRYGAPLRRDVPLATSGLFDPLGKPDRHGEVCMVIRRPSGTLITARKTFYPAHAYRLLTGGIRHGEPLYDALLRETEEETGLEVEISRFLAVVGYDVQRPRRHKGAPASGRLFHTFAFLLEERGGTLACYDPDERLEDFREIAIDELPALAEQLDQLGQQFDPEIHGRWRDWGRFRAVIHRVVHEALRDGSQ